jgi:very-short-patch-repair endonuclease
LGGAAGPATGGLQIPAPTSIGPFIVDFACTRHGLIVEADGGQHQEEPCDARRTAWLESRGWRVLRFWNNDILANTEGVVSTILEALHGG